MTHPPNVAELPGELPREPEADQLIEWLAGWLADVAMNGAESETQGDSADAAS